MFAHTTHKQLKYVYQTKSINSIRKRLKQHLCTIFLSTWHYVKSTEPHLGYKNSTHNNLTRILITDPNCYTTGKRKCMLQPQQCWHKSGGTNGREHRSQCDSSYGFSVTVRITVTGYIIFQLQLQLVFFSVTVKVTHVVIGMIEKAIHDRRQR